MVSPHFFRQSLPPQLEERHVSVFAVSIKVSLETVSGSLDRDGVRSFDTEVQGNEDEGDRLVTGQYTRPTVTFPPLHRGPPPSIDTNSCQGSFPGSVDWCLRPTYSRCQEHNK